MLGMSLFWVIAPCSLPDIYRRFRGFFVVAIIRATSKPRLRKRMLKQKQDSLGRGFVEFLHGPACFCFNVRFYIFGLLIALMMETAIISETSTSARPCGAVYQKAAVLIPFRLRTSFYELDFLTDDL